MAKILLVDDDEFICHLYEFHLKSAGFEVIVACNGIEAIEKTKVGKPDLILLDIIMPIKNGFEVLEELKKDEEHKKIPVIIVSNLSQKTDFEEGLRLGAEEFLNKDKNMVKQIIKRAKHYLGLMDE